MMQVDMGVLQWIKADRNFIYKPFSKTINLLDTIPERPTGSFYPRDFTNNPDRITNSDLDLLTNQDLMLAMGVVVQAQDDPVLSPFQNFNNTDFITNNMVGFGYPLLGFRTSYAFNYYALLSNF
jgi:hypothetical protein